MNWDEFEKRMKALELPHATLDEANLLENDLQEKCTFEERRALFDKWARTYGFLSNCLEKE